MTTPETPKSDNAPETLKTPPGECSGGSHCSELLDAALTLLAEWCVAVEDNGAGWDEWDKWYKDANYRPGPLRELIDAKKEIARNKWK